MSRATDPKDQGATPPAAKELVLFKFDACPFCQKAMRAASRLGVRVVYRDILTDPDAAATLMRIGGQDQVPCLFIDGKPLYESDAIVAFLEQYAKSRA